MAERMLSPEEYTALCACVDKWDKLQMRTGETDKAGVTDALTTLYTKYDLPCPGIVWCASPLSLILTMHAVATQAKVLKPQAFNHLFSHWVPAEMRDALLAAATQGFNDTYALDLPPVSVNHFLPNDIFRRRSGESLVTTNEHLFDWLDQTIKLTGVPLETMAMRFAVQPRQLFGTGMLVSSSTTVVNDSSVDLDNVTLEPLWQVLHMPISDAEILCKEDFLETVMREITPSPQSLARHKLAQSCFAVSVSTNIAFVSASPTELHVQGGLLHADGTPAIAWADGLKAWMLHSIVVPQDVAETPAEQIDPQLVLKEQNVNIRREIVRKIGVERLIQKLGAISVDKQDDDYELLDVGAAFPDKRYRPYLKMRNPSTGTWHVEGVGPDCRTVAQALAWRNESPVAPEVIA